VSLGVRGLNLGIDFEGGVVWEVPAGEITVSEAQEAMDEQGITEATVQTLESDDGVLLRVESEALDTDLAREVSNRLAELTGSDVEDVNLTSVGPSWGDEISEKALRALIVFLVVVTIYISFRFELRMALPTLAALIHDVLVTVGVYSIFGFEVTPATVIAVLTILGFSIYDGIVVFDKVEENVNQVTSAGQGTTYGTMVNRSLNEVLMRSLNTSITAVFPVLSLLVLGSWILGASTLEEFGLALLIGLISGAYSSLYIATPLHAWMKEREPKYKAIKEKVAAKRPSDKELATVGAAAPAATAARGWGAARPDPSGDQPAPADGDGGAADVPAPADDGPAPTVAPTAPPVARPAGTGAPAIPPRPRKKGKRR
jgi:preprotein translocase subunit SecF